MTAASARPEITQGNIDNAVESKMLGVYKRLDELSTSTENRFDMQAKMTQDLTTTVKEMSERLRKMETENIGVLTMLQQQMVTAERRIDETRQDLVEAKAERQKDIDALNAEVKSVRCQIPDDLKERLKKLEDAIPSIAMTNKIIVFIGATLLSAVVALLVAIFTGRASIVFH